MRLNPILQGLKSKPGADPSAGWNTQIASRNWSHEGRSTVWDSTAPQIGQVISEDESMVLINVERIGYVYIYYIYVYILIYVYVELFGCVGWHVKWHFSAACPSSSCRWTDKKADGFLIIFLSFSYHFLITQLPCLIHVLRMSQVSHLFCSGNPWTFSDMNSACFKDIPRIFRATHISVPLKSFMNSRDTAVEHLWRLEIWFFPFRNDLETHLLPTQIGTTEDGGRSLGTKSGNSVRLMEPLILPAMGTCMLVISVNCECVVSCCCSFWWLPDCFQHHEMSCPAIVVIAPTLDFVTVMLLQFFWVYDWWFIMFHLGFIFGRCICDSIIFIVVSQPHMLRISLSLSRCFSRYCIYIYIYIYSIHIILYIYI